MCNVQLNEFIVNMVLACVEVQESTFDNLLF